MTTQELYELTRGHEGRPYWPGGLEYAECETDDGDPAPGLWTLEVGGIDIDHDEADDWKRSEDDEPQSAASILPATAAEWLIIGSAVKWLVENNHSPWCGRQENFVRHVTLNKTRYDDTSILGALLAACKAEEEGR